MNKISEIEKISLPVEGMTCASCVARVEKVISNFKDLENVVVNLATEKVSFSADKNKVNFDALAKQVQDAGYKLDISGLDKTKIDDWTNSKTAYKNSYEENLRKDLIFSLIFTAPVFALSMGSMFELFWKIFPLNIEQLNKLLLLLTTPVIFIPGKRFFSSFWKNSKQFTADMNSLVAIGTGSAYLFSVAITLFPEFFINQQNSHIYFDTSAVIITLIILGKWLEHRAKSRTGEAVSKLIELRPSKAIVLIDGKEQLKNIEDLIPGDIVLIKPGEKLPADGVIIKGHSSLDESMITGESLPVDKNEGSYVIGGTINKTGSFEFRVSKTGSESMLGQIIKLVEDAQGSKAPIQKLADKIASVFVPVVIGIAIISFITWMFVEGLNGFNIALINFISVLIIACPCALGLATPTALIVGMGNGARKGILIKNGEGLETLYKINTLVFDKTGTLTEGKPQVEKIYSIGIKENELLGYLASIETRSEHPIAKAIIEFTKKKNISTKDIDNFESFTGYGLKALVSNKKIVAGNEALMRKEKVDLSKNKNLVEELIAEAGTLVFVAMDAVLVGIISIKDPIKSNVKEVIKSIKNAGIKTVLLSGDNKKSVESISEEIGFDEYSAEVLPSDKSEIIKKYQSQKNIVAMVGDGINDAPALAQADVGISLGTGTDVAIETGDVVLMSGDLKNVTSAIKLSKKVIRIIKQNLFWAFFYNVIGIPLAAMGMLNPMFAALAMSFSSVSVVSNSLRLRKDKN